MGATDIAKDAIRIATTAGLSKDVIDLLEKKVSLLTDEINNLESENKSLQSKVSTLEAENADLKKQIQNSIQANHDLSPTEVEQKIIFYLKNNPRSSVRQISASTGIGPKTVSDLLEQYAIEGRAECSFDSPDSDPLWTLHLGIPVT